MNIVFMGTPDFAVSSLDILVKNKCNIVAVVTVPDKPAGRGQKIRQSPVKLYALEKGLNILQPEKLKDESFIRELKKMDPDVIVVVAFRMLPKEVWSIPIKGTFNLHSSLLPEYRGAAPINWAIINGEKETGVTTFFIDEKIDTGEIILQNKIEIKYTDDAEILHDKLMGNGAELVLKTIKFIEQGLVKTISQNDVLSNKKFNVAPKIFKVDCKINWDKDGVDIYNMIRGLSPYPCAWTELKFPSNKIAKLKVYKVLLVEEKHDQPLGLLQTDGKKYLKVTVKNGVIDILDLQMEGKKRMLVKDFLRGVNLENVNLI